MSDPLGLLPDAKPINQDSIDPLGLISKPTPDPRNPSLRSAPVEVEVNDFGLGMWGGAFDPKINRDKAANAITLSESTGLPPSVVYENMDRITSDMGLRDQPGVREFTEKAMIAPVAYGLMAHPLATVLGLGAFGLLSEAENYAVSKFKDKPYEFGAGKGLADLLPIEAGDAVKDLFWLADMAGKAVLAGGLTAGAKSAGNQFAARYMRDMTETYNLPRNVYISPEKIREFHGMGREDVITPEEANLLKDLNLTRRDYINALREGIDIEIPVEKIVTIQDKPWVKGVKDFFKISPYFEENVIPAGGPKGSRPVAGLLEGEARREFGDILKDVGTILNETGKGRLGNERGSVGGPREMSPAELEARRRLKGDLKIFRQEASKTGQDLSSFLIEKGFSEEAAASMMTLDAEVQKADEYKISHRPNPDGPPSHDLLSTDLAPEDIYDHPEYYTGDKNSHGFRESYVAIRDIRNKPDAIVTVYRASPVNELNEGDWVSFSKDYAKKEGMADDPSEDIPVFAYKVKASDVRWAGDAYEEFGYFPKEKGKLRPLPEIIKDILSAMADVKGPKGERGSFSKKDISSPEARAARERLKKDYEILKREAADRGRDLAEYLIENGVTPEAATFMINTFGEPDKPAETVNQLLDMAAQTDRATFGQELPENPEYDAIRQKAAELAYAKVQKRIDVNKRREEGLIRKQAVIDAREHPVFQAMEEIISSGGLNEGALSKEYGKETIAELRKRRPGLVTKEGGYGADDAAANLTGGVFESGDDLVNAILDWKGLKEEAKGFERWDYLLSEQEEGDFYLDVLNEESKILRKLLKENAPKPATGLKRIIRGETGQIRVDELMVSEYDALKAGMKKAEQASRKAFREGRIEGALAEKERQIAIAEKLKARLEAKKEALGFKDGILALTKDKTIPPEYRDQIEGLLSDYDLLPRSERTRQRIESAREFIERQEAAGEDVTIPKSLMDKIDRYGKIHWRDMTLEQLRDVFDQATMIAHLGKLKNTLLAAKKKGDYEKTVLGVIDSIQGKWLTKGPPTIIESMLRDPGMAEKAGEQARGYLAELTKPEFIFRKLDKWEEQGPAWDALYAPIKAASDAEIKAMLPITDRLQAIFKPLTKGRGRSWSDEKIKIDGVPGLWPKEKLIMIALNTGNEGNMAALIQGLNLTREQIQKMTNKLTPEEWVLVKDIWALLDEQYPRLNGVYKALTGAELRRVEGDYFPLVFDRSLSWVADKNAAEAEQRDFFQTIYTKPKPASGFTIERKGGKLPVKLSFDVIFNHLYDVNHYATHALAVRDVQKIIGDPRIRGAIETSEGGGPEAYRQLMPWLQEVAKPRTEPLTITEGWLKTLRRNTTAVALGVKFSVALSQWLGMFNSIEEVGSVPYVKSLAEFYTHREAMVDQIKAMSPEMSARASSWDRELKDAYGRLGLEKFRGQQAIKDSFFGLITLMDLAVSYPTWLAGYDAGMKMFPADRAKAIEHADFMVRKSQGNAMPKDLAGIQRGPELKKFVTMFYTFFSAMQNQIGEVNAKFSAGEKGVGGLVKGWWWIVVLPAVMGYILKEREIPSPKQAAKEIIQFRLGGYPFIRDIFSPVFTDYDYAFSPAMRAGEVMGKAFKEGANLTPFTDDEADFEKLFRYGFESAGYLTGFPTGQALITWKGFNDLKNGETSDLTRLLMRAPKGEED